MSPDLRVALFDLRDRVAATAAAGGDPDDVYRQLVVVLVASGRLEAAAEVRSWFGDWAARPGPFAEPTRG